MTLHHPAYAQLRQVTPVAAVMLENNPSMYALEGTNTWILRAPGNDECIVVDPGDDDPAHLARVAGAGTVALTLISHRHHDHTGGIDKFVELTGAPVRAVREELRRGGGAGLEHDELIEAAGLTLRVLRTPGHTADSVSFVIEDEGSVLTADTILGRGTTVLDASDGNLGDYLESMRVLIGLGAGRMVLPGHGPELPDLETVARRYLAHREERLTQIRGALDALGADADVRAVVEHVYTDIDETLWPAAEQSVRVQLEYLRD
ncbi:MBL fold metallo-hydrolase [Rhodococcus spongiicola]|uniref:MBL fold metallo-hydrolase n=1 Tax=Rhodococcus spongiicola TaxID=2487352 RepID=A0A3S3DWZ7_9NOCA|nr:MBL fold metallo-hydrolase [Rhodococcus spongiicola]RVW00983.1 MBL fold metallo-hydrolase [Rhodococcus spongiicola]